MQILLAGVLAIATLGAASKPPTVSLSYGKFQGSTVGGLDSFLGIPFAQAERFGLPHTPGQLHGVQQAITFGPECPQQATTVPPIRALQKRQSNATAGQSEDCLSINVIRPQGAVGKKFPVLFWIYGGGFEIGSSNQNPGKPVVARSIANGEPVIYVSANYRLNAFGFLASKEVKEAGLGNLGLRDQRFAMQWIQQNIAKFGGDPSKVTIWGESAGALSVAYHLFTNAGNPDGLFRGAFMESGSPLGLVDITEGQPVYDQVVCATGCASAQDTLACLKKVPFEDLLAAVNETPNLFTYQSLREAWRPTIDGVFLTEDPFTKSLQKGKYAKVPFVTGDCDDEGTLFTLVQNNVTTEQEGTEYLHQNYFPDATDKQFAPLAAAYPSDPTQGSPFDTGTANQLTPQFKRLAAFQGDWAFQAPRRYFLTFASKTQRTFTFLYKRQKSTAFLGSFHSTDIPEFYGSSTAPPPTFQGTDYLLNFANSLDPNGDKPLRQGLIAWPQFDEGSRQMLFFTGNDTLEIGEDTYREQAMLDMVDLMLQVPPGPP